jgi:hypothetical protein
VLGPQVVGFALDVRDEQSVATFTDEACERFVSRVVLLNHPRLAVVASGVEL